MPQGRNRKGPRNENFSYFDASDIAEHINISASDVANNLDVDDVATYVADNLDTNDVADYIDVSDLATYIDAGDVAGYIDTEEIADNIDISKVANHMLTKSYEESDGSATEEFPSYFSELSLELKLIRNLVSDNEVLAKQLHDAKAISSALQDSLDRVTRERNQLQLDNEQAERDDKEAEVH